MANFESKFSDASMSPGFLLWKVSNLHQRIQRKSLEALDLTPSQFSVLTCYFFLSKKSDVVNQTDVCHLSGIDKMLVSDLTKTLLRKHYIKSSINKTDRRSFNVEVTSEGEMCAIKLSKSSKSLTLSFLAN